MPPRDPQCRERQHEHEVEVELAGPAHRRDVAEEHGEHVRPVVGDDDGGVEEDSQCHYG